jgi:hypothetical protein
VCRGFYAYETKILFETESGLEKQVKWLTEKIIMSESQRRLQ